MTDGPEQIPTAAQAHVLKQLGEAAGNIRRAELLAQVKTGYMGFQLCLGVVRSCIEAVEKTRDRVLVIRYLGTLFKALHDFKGGPVAASADNAILVTDQLRSTL